ncbi:MAG: hypothetical protein KAX49_20825, partial [Halanaerobiales bacterium]|nr:hypothetical protein [Halanaerobiales bacterium]
YDPEIGRFNREDEYRGSIFNPQSQNLCIYVLQNPLKFIDPSGHEPRFNGEVGNVYRWYYGSDLIWSSLKEPEPKFNIGALALEIQWLDVKGTEEEKLDLSLYVALFQANANLDVTGEIDPKTLDFLGKYGVLYLSEKNIGLDDWLIKRYKSSEKYKNERLRWVLEHPEEYYNYLSIKLSYKGLEWMGYIELGGALFQELKGILAARGLTKSVNLSDDAVRFFDDLQRFSDEMNAVPDLSKKALKHPLNDHMPSRYAKQVSYQSREIVEEYLSKKSFFNPSWAEEQVSTALNSAYKDAVSKGTKNGYHLFDIYGEQISIYMRDGNFSTGFGMHKLTYDDIMKFGK